MNQSINQLQSIIKNCQNGDKQAFKHLYDSFKNSLFAICLRYFPDRMEAEDMLQDSFILIFKNIDKYDSNKGAFYTWASTIVVNTILSKLRKNKPLLVYGEELPNVQDHHMDVPIENMAMKEIVQLIQSLPEGYRRVFNMYVMDGMKHKEIAEHMGISINTSKTQLMYAKKAMQKKLLELKTYSQVN